MQIRLPVAVAPGTISSTSTNGLIVNMGVLAKEKVGIYLSKKRTEKPYDDLPKTLEGLQDIESKIKERKIANNGKITPDDKKLQKKIKTQKKLIGEANIQKRKSD